MNVKINSFNVKPKHGLNFSFNKGADKGGGE